MMFEEILKTKVGIHIGNPVSKDEIKEAEKRLSCRFTDEYREYLKECGIASFEGHELTGICEFPRLNVCDVTIAQRTLNSKIPTDHYVIEELHIDGIVIWQSPEGEIYQAASNSEPVRICESFKEYINL